MSAEQGTTCRETGVAGVPALDRLGYRLQRLPLHLVIIIFCAVWIVPTIGLRINSFRSVSDMGQAGWWATLFPPHGFSLASYQQVRNVEGAGPSLVKSVRTTA